MCMSLRSWVSGWCVPGGSVPHLCVAEVCRGTCKQGQAGPQETPFGLDKQALLSSALQGLQETTQRIRGQVLIIMSQPQEYLNIAQSLSALVHIRSPGCLRPIWRETFFKAPQTRLRTTCTVLIWCKMTGGETKLIKQNTCSQNESLEGLPNWPGWFLCYLQQWFSNFRAHENHLEGLLQQILGPNPRVSHSASLGSAKEFAFLTHSQVMLILLVPEL